MKLCLLAFLVVITGCSGSLRSTNYPTLRELTIHADSEFTQEERRIITHATSALVSQAWIGIHVVYDLDFSKAESLRRTPQLIRVSAESPLTRDLDLKYRAVVYGWTYTVPYPAVYLVYDRLGNEDFARHVVMHELLHALGCEHVRDPDAVLYLVTDRLHKSVRMTPADIAELDRASRLTR